MIKRYFSCPTCSWHVVSQGLIGSLLFSQPVARRSTHQQAIILYLPPITPLFFKFFLRLYGPLLSNFWDYLELRRSAYSLYRESVCLVNQQIPFSTEKFLVTVVGLLENTLSILVHICQHTPKTIFQNRGNICQPIHLSFGHPKRQKIVKGTTDAGIEEFKSTNDFMFNFNFTQSHNLLQLTRQYKEEPWVQ